MPTPTKGPRLGGSPNHEKLILRNLAQSLFEHGRITTTEAKAKRLRPYAEKLITTAKRGDLHARREILKVIRDKNVVHALFADIAPTFAARNGGYTRIIKTAPRKGDNAPMAIIELITEETVATEASKATRRAARVRSTQSDTTATAAAAPAAAEETTSEDSTVEVEDTIEQGDKQAEQAAEVAPVEGAPVDGDNADETAKDADKS